MTRSEAEVKRLELRSVLMDASAYLLQFGETTWAGILNDWRRLIEERDFGTVRTIQSSGRALTDIYLHPVNGHRLTEAQVDAANKTLRTFWSRMGELSKALYRY